MLVSQSTTGIYMFSELEVLENNCIYKYIVLSQVGITAEPSQQQQRIPEQQTVQQQRYTKRQKEGEKRASKTLCQEQNKGKKKGTQMTLRFWNLNRGVDGWRD